MRILVYPYIVKILIFLVFLAVIIILIYKTGFSSKKDISDIKYTLNYKKEYILSLEQKEALIGIILGDGFLDRAKPKK